MRLYTPLDLRNVKDIHTRSAFRRLDQWLRDLAGNLSPTQEGSTSQQITIIQQTLAAQAPIVPMRFDDFTKVFQLAGDYNLFPFDGMAWKVTTGGGANEIRDNRTAADTTYADTGQWIIDPAVGPGVVKAIISGDPTAQATIFPGLRSGAQFDYWIGQPSGNPVEGWWGVGQPGGGSYANPDHCVRFILYRHPTLSYDSFFPGVVYTGTTSPTTDFIGLQYRHPTGPVHIIYRMGKASDYQTAAKTNPLKCSLLFQRDTPAVPGVYKVTASIPGMLTTTVLALNLQGYVHIGGVQEGATAATGKIYLDAFMASRPLPT